MKVSELILLLQTLPPDSIVVTHGYEGGFNDLSAPRPASLMLNVNTAWYYGKHEEAEENEPGVPAIIL